MKKLLLASAIALVPSLAWAQGAVLQNGPVVKFDLPGWVQDKTIMSGGKMFTDNFRGFNPAHFFDNHGPGVCTEDALTNGPYHQICIGHSATGAATVTVTANNGATAQGLNFVVDGVTLPFPGSGAGNVSSLFSTAPGSLMVSDNTIGTLIRDVNSSTQVVGVVANTPLEGIYATGTGAKVSMCPGYAYGCPDGGAQILSMFAAVNETIGGPTQNESTLYVFMKSNTGEVHPWTASTVYTVNGYVMNGLSLYQQTVTSCTSAGSGGPTGTGTAIVDNTCRWNYKGPSYAAAKQALNYILSALPGSGSVWGAAGGAQLENGWNGNFATGHESDLNNFSAIDPGSSSLRMLGFYLGGPTGTHPISAMLYIGKPANATNYGAYEGIWIDGPYQTKDHDIRISTLHGEIGYLDEGAHVVSSIFDFATTPVGLTLGGNYSSSAIDSNSTINIHRAVAGLPFNAMLISNNSAVASTSVNFQFATGSVNSFATIGLSDASQFSFFGGAALVNGIGITTTTGPIQLSAASGALKFTGLNAVAAGTGKRFLCIDTTTKFVYEGTGVSCN